MENQEFDKDKILKTVRDLMALSESSNYTGEKETAYRKASELMAKYHIKKEETRVTEEVIEVWIRFNGMRLKMWKMNLYSYIAKENGVALFYDNGSNFIEGLAGVSLIGRKDDIDSVIYFYNNLETQIEKMTNIWYADYKKLFKEMAEAKGYYNIKPSSKKKNDYRTGLIVGVRRIFENLNSGSDQMQKEWGLVPVNENKIRHKEADEKYKSENKTFTRTIKIRHTDATGAGVRDSKNLSLQGAVENKGAPLQLEG